MKKSTILADNQPAPTGVALRRFVRRLPRKYPHWFGTLKGCAHGPKEATLPWWKVVVDKMDMKSSNQNCGITRYWFYTKWGAFLIEWGE